MNRLLHSCLIISLFGFIWVAFIPAVYAQSLPAVSYSAANNTVYVGDNYDLNNPNEAPYVGYPSHPNAPKSVISLAQVANALSERNLPNLLLDQGNSVWLLRANLTVEQNARLEIAAAAVRELRLESVADGADKRYVKLSARGGSLLIRGAKVYAWNSAANQVDTDVTLGRSYIAALNGARLEVIDAELSYLGWREINTGAPVGTIGKGESSGVAWRRRATDTLPETGPVGKISNSYFHHNYIGAHLSQAVEMTITDSRFSDNVVYGLDIHDESNRFVVAKNQAFNNGSHGLLVANRSGGHTLSQNKLYKNGRNGLLLDRGITQTAITANEVYANGEDGIVLFQSSQNQLNDNFVHHNLRYGIRLAAPLEPNASFDSTASDNTLVSNTVQANGSSGVVMQERSDRNRIRNNRIIQNNKDGINLMGGGNRIETNVIASNTGDGIYVLGNPQSDPTGADHEIAQAAPVENPGQSNLFDANVVEFNGGNGIEINGGASNSIGASTGNEIRSNQQNGIRLLKGTSDTLILNNVIHRNGLDGVALSDSLTLRNGITQNSIAENGGNGITLGRGNQRLAAPVILGVTGATQMQLLGNATPGVQIEVYRDQGGEGMLYQGSVMAFESGSWSLTVSDDPTLEEGGFTALAIDGAGNTSEFSAYVPYRFIE
jgi:parallel beta-helix repeat protein